ncbi:MAG: repair protein SbcC/Rad50 [Pseudonocardiales bacterium]|nr:repair protein SbcC/Rad50 [Pseudonocardiales bacterium]
MRLHRLTMVAIGPFAGRADIDFTRLGDSGLFLLEGPTGAGKSTVIDAISFALYGKVAQLSAHGERLRSHHADPGTEPVVELVFETQNGSYRVRRTPTFDRPKKHGSGTTRVNGTVKIWRITHPDDPDGGEPLSTRVSEADDEITRAIGLSHDQFVQTVVLPQGEFANFLRSKTDDKRALLQKLFGTQVLARTQERLVEARKAAEQRRAGSRIALSRAVQAFVGASGAAGNIAAEAELAIEQGRHAELEAFVLNLLADLEAAANAASTRRAEATRARISAQRSLESGRDLLRRMSKRAALLAQRGKLIALLEPINADRAELAAAELAQRVDPAADSLGAAIAASDAGQEADRAARAALSGPLAAAAEPELRTAAAEVRQRIGELAEDLRRENQLPAIVGDLSRTAAEAEGLGALIAQARDELNLLPGRITELRHARASFAIVAAQQAGLTAEADRAHQRRAAAVQATEAAATLAQERQITLAAHAAWDQQEQALAGMRVSWRAGVAGELGRALTAGAPCVVCGSAVHPKPARPKKHHVSQDDLDGAEAESQRLRRAMQSAQGQLTKQEAQLIELQIIADQLSPQQAQAKVDQLEQAVLEARLAGERCTELDAELTDTEQRSRQLEEQVSHAEIARAGLAERADTMAAQVAESRRLVDAARAEYRCVADRLVALEHLVTDLDAAAAASATAAVALARAVECGELFTQALTAAGFEDELTWSAARRSTAEIAQLRTAVDGFDEEWRAVHSQLSEAELLDPALDAPAPELAPLTDAVLDAEQLEAELAALSGSTRAQWDSSAEHGRVVTQLMLTGAGVLAETAAVIRLGNLAAGSGDNQLKMELTTYVLVRRFEDVVSAANAQLRRISGGRYELEHTDARSGNAKSGLGLSVLDLRTGRPRDPGTLSGGETFYVSLSLALGLADVVRAEAGGVDLGTLFIDEGFGSLDPEVLDEVLAVLDSLRTGGRTVGVVSHVAEMKMRIAERIEVRPNPDGSSRLTVVA